MKQSRNQNVVCIKLIVDQSKCMNNKLKHGRQLKKFAVIISIEIKLKKDRSTTIKKEKMDMEE